MSIDKVGQRLHDRATHGESLTAEEQVQLDQWYARQDGEDAATLTRNPSAQSIHGLQAQVDAAVAQLLEVSQRIKTQAAENEKLRREVAELQRQLAQKPTTQPA
jgi:uncharacterized protein YceH (UPF0502 family)